jgi:hypothetical protein
MYARSPVKPGCVHIGGQGLGCKGGFVSVSLQLESVVKEVTSATGALSIPRRCHYRPRNGWGFTVS